MEFFNILLVFGIIVLLCCSGKAEKIMCNSDIDAMLKDVNADIKSRSPIKKEDKPMCDFVTVYGADTITRVGDIYGEVSAKDPDCFEQQFKIKFVSLNVTCNVNMKKLMDEVDRVVKEMISGKKKKRGLPIKKEIGGTLIIIWNNMCLSGKIKVCQNDQSKSQADNIKLCSVSDVKNCDIQCSGSLQLRSLCEDDNFVKKLREAIGAVFQEVMQKEFTDGLREGPSQILQKFNCGKLTHGN